MFLLRDRPSTGVRPSTEHPRAAIGLLEQLRRQGDTLGGTKKQHALRTKRVVERSQDPTLRERVQIDEKIAAADQVQSRERRIARHILPREQAQIANVLRNAVLAVLSHEESVEAFSRDFVQEIGVVRPPRAVCSAASLTSVPKSWIPGVGTRSPRYSRRAMAME